MLAAQDYSIELPVIIEAMSDSELKDFLVKSGFVSRAESNFLSEDEVRRATAHALGVPFVELDRDSVRQESLFHIPEPVSRKHNVVAFAESEKGVEVALLNINDLKEIQSLVLSKKVLPRLTSKESITRALLIYQKHLREKFGEDISRALKSDSVDALTEALLRHALYSQAKAIHLHEHGEGVSVYYRISHALYEAMQLPVRIADAFFKKLHDLHAKKTQVGDVSVRLRHYAAPGKTSRRSTLHLLREGTGAHGFTLESLGFRAEPMERVHRALAHESGLILVCGPNGSGKTTTLYTLLDLLSHPHLAVSTVESQIEFKFPRITQTPVDPELGLTTAASLRATLKTDPDVVMVGEIGDAQTALVALQAASRGVLVLAGIETHSAVQGIEKMLAFGVPGAMLAGALRASIGLSLRERLASDIQTQKITRAQEGALEERANFGRVLAALKEEGVLEKAVQWKDVPFATEGSTAGHIGLQEVLEVSSTIAHLIKTGASPEHIEEAARDEGMLTLAEDALAKSAMGLLALHTV